MIRKVSPNLMPRLRRSLEGSGHLLAFLSCVCVAHSCSRTRGNVLLTSAGAARVWTD